jgi:LPXTG-site transpeptidase (sortase) family protein
MLFTEIEKDIAKQILKIGLSILIIFTLFTILFNVLSSVKNTDSFNQVKNQTKPEEKELEKEEFVISKPVNVKTYLPVSVEIPGYNITANVESPVSTDVKVLDSALTRSAVYYPGSGTPGFNNTLIFGHSTAFKIVRNKAYQIFNNLKNVPVGTLVYVKTEDAVHIYKTTKVERVSKYSTWIQFKSEKPMLTLATCDSFGKASDRWVLEAEYVGVQ